MTNMFNLQCAGCCKCFQTKHARNCTWLFANGWALVGFCIIADTHIVWTRSVSNFNNWSAWTQHKTGENFGDDHSHDGSWHTGHRRLEFTCANDFCEVPQDFPGAPCFPSLYQVPFELSTREHTGHAHQKQYHITQQEKTSRWRTAIESYPSSQVCVPRRLRFRPLGTASTCTSECCWWPTGRSSFLFEDWRFRLVVFFLCCSSEKNSFPKTIQKKIWNAWRFWKIARAIATLDIWTRVAFDCSQYTESTWQIWRRSVVFVYQQVSVYTLLSAFASSWK